MTRDKIQTTLISIGLIVSILFALFPNKPEPVGQSPLPEIQREEAGKAQKTDIISKPLQACIFNEGIRGCVYNDRLGRKEGPDAYKWYDMDAVLWKVAR